MEYGQFCPIAKATEIIGEKWTVLIIREALMGRNLDPKTWCRFPILSGGFERELSEL